MPWQQWILLAMYGVNIVGTPILVGRKRDPVTPGVAAGAVALNLLWVWLLLSI